MQCIQCGGGSLSLDIFGFPSFPYVHDAHLYQGSLVEGCSNHLSTYLSCTYHIRRYLSPWTTFPFIIYSLHPEYGPFFIIRSSSDHHASRTRLKAHYTIWAINPTIAPQNSSFFLSSEEKAGVLKF